MNKQDENKLVMMKALLSYLKINQPIWNGSIPFTAAVDELEVLIFQIETLRQSTDVDQSGQVVEKRTLKAELVNKIFEISSPIYAMACKTKDMVLQAQIDFSKSELEGQRDGELVSTTNTVMEIGTSKLFELTTYAVTGVDFQQLDEIKQRYERSLSAPRLSVSERKVNNEKLKTLMRNSKAILIDQLKRLMIRYQTANPDFYAGYLNASKIVNYGIRHDNPENPE